MLLNEIRIEVLFSDIDSMMIAHNSKYYIWFESGRFHFSSKVLNFSRKEIIGEYSLPVIKSSCKYLHPIIFGNILTEKTYLYFENTSKITFFYKIMNENNILCAIGSTEHVIINANGKMLTQFPQDIHDKLNIAKTNINIAF